MEPFRRLPANTRFLVKLALFAAPILMYLALTAAIPLYAGEFAAVEDVAARQSAGEPILYGPAYRDNYYVFKLASTIRRRPDVLVLGSSRSMQFRAGLVARNERFYNAGGAAQSIFEARRFITDLPDGALPRLLLVGLDQPWFNSRTEANGLSRIQHQIEAERGAAANRAMNTSRFFFWDLCQGKIPLRQLLRRQDPLYGRTAVGIAAAVRGAGFREDGSYQYGTVLNPEPVDRRLAEGYQRLRDDAGHLTHGDAVAQQNLDEVDALLTLSRARGMDVVGFAPPYAPGIYRAMAEDGRHTYLARSAASLAAVFARRGFRFFDFTDAAAAAGAADDDMIDDVHPSEFVCLKMYLTMLESLPGVLGRYSDSGFLRERASTPRVHRLLAFDSDGR